MTDYAHGSSARLGMRADLGKLADRYAEEYGVGPKSSRVALRACSKKIVQSSGDVTFLAKTFYNTDDMSNDAGQRFPGGSIPQAQAGSTTALHVTLRDLGKEVRYDLLSPDTHSLQIQGGDALVESVYTAKAVIKTLEAMDYLLAARLIGVAAANPWTATEVDCSGTKWSAATNTAVTQLNNAVINYDGDLDSVILSRKATNYLRNCSDVVDGYGGNTGAGLPLDMERFGNFWLSLGISKVYIADTALFSHYVTLFRGGSGDAETDPSGVVRCHKPQPGENANGMLVSMAEYDHAKTRGIYAPSTDDIVVIPSLGVRLLNVY